MNDAGDGSLSRLWSIPMWRGGSRHGRTPESRLVDVDHPVSNLVEADGFVIASATDLGRKRSGNEDSHALWVADDAVLRAKHGMLVVVCDGMGGASAGEVASQLAVSTVVDRVRNSPGADPAEVLREAVEQANSAVHSQAAANAEQRGMGTTCTALLVRGGDVWIGHVGDSRAYLVRGGKARQLTKDHSLVAELVEKGHLSAAEAKHDHRRNVVTRSVGALDHVQVDAELVLEGTAAGDVFVVCSDGLHGLVTDAEIARLASELPPAEACAALIDLANERGGPDNITAVVARRAGAAAGAPAPAAAREPKSAGESPATSSKERTAKSPPPLGLLGVVAGVLLLLVVTVGAVLFGQLKRPATAGLAADPAPTASGAPAAGGSSGASAMAEPGPAGAGNTASPERPATPVASSPPPVPEAAATAPPRTAPATPPPSKPASPAVAPANPVSAPAAGGRPGTVRLMTRPFQPSTFTIDGEVYAQDVGFLTQSLPAGDHVVRVEASGGGAVDVPVHVESGGSYSLVAELPFEGALGNIEIAISGASRAQVLVDGAQYPEPAPCTVRGLAPGPHTIRVMRPKSALPQGPGEVQVLAGGTVRAEYRFGTSR